MLDAFALHPKVTLTGALVAAIVSILLICRMSPDSSVQNMLPRGNPSTEAMGHVLSDFSAADQMLILATAPTAGDQAKLLSFAARLESAVKSSPGASGKVEAVVYQPDEQSRQFITQKVAPAAIYYLSDARYRLAQARLTRADMTRQIQQDEAMISAPGPAAGALAAAFLQDPLRLHEFLIDEMKSRMPAGFGGGTGGFFSTDGKSLLIRIVGNRSLDDLEYAGQLTDAISQLSSVVNTDHFHLDISGGYAIAAASERAIRHDMIVSVFSSVILLQALFIVAYRKPVRYFLLAFVPVALGLLYGFGIRAMVSSAISPAAAVVGAVLAGMGIDYTVLYLPHYHTARAAGLSPLNAVAQTTRQLLSPLTAACFTSVIGFAAIGWSSVPALRDFSLVGSLGLLGALICAVVILPALLVAQDRGGGSDRPRWRLDPLLNRVAHFRRQCIWIWMAICLIAAAVIAFTPGDLLPMESDLTVMHPRPNPALAAETTIARRMGTDPGAMAVYLHASTATELVKLAYDVQNRLASSAVKDCGVVGVFGIANLLPDPRVVDERRQSSLIAGGESPDLPTAVAQKPGLPPPAIKEDVTAAPFVPTLSSQSPLHESAIFAIVPSTRKDQNAPPNPQQVVTDFRAVITDSSFDPAAFTGYETFLKSMLSNPPVPTLADLANDPRIAENFLSRGELTGQRGATPEAMTLIFFDHPLDTRPQRQTAVAAIRQSLAGCSGATLTGLGVISLDTETTIAHDLPRLLLAALGLNVLYLLVHFRSIASAVLAMIPTGVSLLLLLAFARLVELKLNLVNLVALPLLIGIDVDYGIYLVSLARPKKPIDRAESHRRVATSGYSVMISAAANALGFGSLLTTSVPAIQSLGLAVGVGVAACFAGTLFLLAPLLMGDKSIAS